MKKKIIIWLIAAAVIVCLALLIHLFFANKKQALLKLRPGDYAESFVIGYKGSVPVRLADMLGKGSIILVFRDSAEGSEKFDGIIKSKFNKIVSMNSRLLWFDIKIKDGRAVLEEKTSRLALKYQSPLDSIPPVYDLSMLPAIYVIDSNGIIKMIYRGYSPTAARDIAAAISGQ